MYEIICRRRWSLTDLAIDLAVPPLGVLAAVVGIGTLVGTSLLALGAIPVWAAAPWLLAAIALPAFVLLGLVAGGARASTFRTLALAPLMVGSDLLTRLRLIRGLRATSWERTQRPSEVRAGLPARPEIGGVPIDPVDSNEALHRTMSAVKARSFTQVCTVNLDFLVNARRDRHVRAVLQDSQLNLADGAPVVWLGRVLGYRLSGRIAGADFVPDLMEESAEAGARVFFLGGENGAARAAAHRLRGKHPNLIIAGVYEPPRAALDEMDNEEILQRLADARPDILLVALGHPKQDKWIHANRGRLPVSVAIGVGCTFDLLAGHRRRAPRWMQKYGLEWFYRLVREPLRLSIRYATDAWWLVAILLPLSLHQRLLNRY
jgi:N-acetylglucosaminyldiphosphoundecaprenol N-acetyl-beta-D-mannosaminyltransferase